MIPTKISSDRSRPICHACAGSVTPPVATVSVETKQKIGIGNLACTDLAKLVAGKSDDQDYVCAND